MACYRCYLALLTVFFAGSIPVDPAERTDNRQRILLFTEGGPVVVELKIDIDGRPFRQLREAVIDEMLALADSDGDGLVTWQEAQTSKKLAAFRRPVALGAQMAMSSEDRPWADLYDGDGDKLVSRLEARRFLAARTGGPAFSVTAGGYRPPEQSGNPAWDLLDQDNDGQLSPEEMDAAPNRLKQRDANDNDALTLGELRQDPLTQQRARLVLVRDANNSNSQPLAFELGESADWDAISQQLDARYSKQLAALKPDKKDGLLASLLQQLDANQDGKFSTDELPGLDHLAPQLEVNVQFDSQSRRYTVELKLLAGPAKGRSAEIPSGRGAVLNAGGTRVRFGTDSTTVASLVQLPALRERTFEMLDRDNSGTLDLPEVRQSQYGKLLASMFESWDGDSDDTVSKQEYLAFFELQQRATSGRVALEVQPAPARLFQALDTDDDLRLGQRELRDAMQRLRELDRNGDERLTLDEVPADLQLDFKLNANSIAGVAVMRPAVPLTAVPERQNGPEWFRSMDRNRDGELNLNEFLGTPAQFKKMDANGDGLVDLGEAMAGEDQGKPSNN